MENPKWEDVDFKILTSANETIPLEIEHNGQTSIPPLRRLPKVPIGPVMLDGIPLPPAFSRS